MLNRQNLMFAGVVITTILVYMMYRASRPTTTNGATA
jgi:hypothetical protein